MTEQEWKKSSVIESGNYPKNSFVGVLKAIYPTVTETGIPVLQLDFEDGKTYNMPTSAKDGQYGVHEDGTVDGFMAIGQFVQSIEKLGVVSGMPTDNPDDKHIETFWAFVDGQPAGFKTEPDIVGKTLHNVARPRQVGDATQTSKYPDWTIGQIDGLTATYPKSKSKPASKPKVKEQPAQTDSVLTDGLIDALTEPKSISELFTGLGKKHKVSEIRVALDKLKAEGMVTTQGDKFVVA